MEKNYGVCPKMSKGGVTFLRNLTFDLFCLLYLVLNASLNWLLNFKIRIYLFNNSWKKLLEYFLLGLLRKVS